MKLSDIDRARRAAEIAGYRQNPSQPMPVMFQVAALGAKVAWPSRFR